MARKKNYIEEEVLEKAMNLFWKNGYEKTSMQMLEEEMGINKFSIYSTFGNKHNLFLESLKCYKTKFDIIFEKLKNGSQGVQDIKQFFYDSVSLGYKDADQKGCLLTSTYNEFAVTEDVLVKNQMVSFMDNLKMLIQEKLRINTPNDEKTVTQQANFLLLAKHGLAAASRVNTKKEIEDFIEMTFKNI